MIILQKRSNVISDLSLVSYLSLVIRSCDQTKLLRQWHQVLGYQVATAVVTTPHSNNLAWENYCSLYQVWTKSFLRIKLRQ